MKNENITNKNEMKKGILGGIISSIIVMIFINPILGFAWKFLNAWFSSYIDSLYLNAALGQRNWIDFITLTFFLLIFIMFGTIKIIEIFFRGKKEFQNQNFLIHNKEIKDDFNYEKIKLQKRIKLMSFIIIGLYPVIILLFFNIIFKTYSDLQLNASFNQRFNIIAPYIDETEEEFIKSNWSQMQKKEDFDKIDRNIENIAKKNKIVLPENLLK